MSQHINLLPPAPRTPLLSFGRAASVLGLWMLLIAVQCLRVSADAEAARIAADNSVHELQQQQQLLQAVQKKLGEARAPGNIAEQIAALEPRTRVSIDLLERLKRGELGSLEGYGAQLTELATVPANGVWITQAAISDAGRKIRLEGRALKKEQVLPYAHQVNAAMQKYGAQLEHVEIAPMRPSTDPNVAMPLVFSFKLY